MNNIIPTVADKQQQIQQKECTDLLLSFISCLLLLVSISSLVKLLLVVLSLSSSAAWTIITCGRILSSATYNSYNFQLNIAQQQQKKVAVNEHHQLKQIEFDRQYTCLSYSYNSYVPSDYNLNWV